MKTKKVRPESRREAKARFDDELNRFNKEARLERYAEHRVKSNYPLTF